jgi:hypothetical protein
MKNNTLLFIIIFCFQLIGQVDYHTEIQPIFNGYCGNCHLGNSAGGFIGMSR